MAGEVIGVQGVRITDLPEAEAVVDSNYMILVDEETGRTYKVKREHIKAQKTSELVDDVGFLRAIPGEYMTESEVREFTDAEIAKIREVLTNLENAKGTIDSNLNVYGDIKLFNTERVSNSEGDTILSSSESGKFIYFRPGGVNNKNGQVVLKENEIVVENGLVVSGNAVLNGGKTLYVGKTEYYEGAINNWAKNDNFVLHLNNGKCFVPSDGINRNNALGHPEQPWQDLYLGLPSISTNGFTKLPNGLIMQWGLIWTDTETGKKHYKVTYPLHYPNDILYFNAQTQGATYDYSRIKCLYGENKRSEMNIVEEKEGPYGTTIRWFAIGY